MTSRVVTKWLVRTIIIKYTLIAIISSALENEVPSGGKNDNNNRIYIAP
jgi:hypothetical protein